MRGSRVVAVARRDLARVLAGRRRWQLPALALSLLLPVGGLRLGTPDRADAVPPVVSTARVRPPVPAVVSDVVTLDPAAATRVVQSDLLRVEGSRVPPAVRAALDAATGSPTVTRTLRAVPLALPGRGVVLVLLALSLLGAPLAESLPGERERHTLEPLLAASVSPLEVVTGKWVAWWGAGSLVAVLAGVGGVLSGANAAGWWLLGPPAVLAGAVALGLWIVRHAGDVVGGATAPMRLLPVVAVALAALAALAQGASPALAALVPLGGALLVSGGHLPGPLPAILAVVSAAGTAAACLWATARQLDATPPSGARWTPLRLALLGAGAWLVGAGTGGAWPLAAAQAASTSTTGGQLGGALVLLSVAALVATAPASPRGTVRPSARGLGAALAVGAALAALTALAPVVSLPGAWGDLLARVSTPPPSLPVACLAVVAQELVFRGPVLRAAPALSVGAWALACSAANPLAGLLGGAALWALASRGGVGLSVLARLVAVVVAAALL